MGSLRSTLERDLGQHKTFVKACLKLKVVTADSLASTTIPHWEREPLLRRLTEEGYLAPDGMWDQQAKSQLQQLCCTQNRPLIHQDPADRPREKAKRSGIRSLSDSELLALILRTGSSDESVLAFADRLLHENDGLLGLADLDVALLQQHLHGLGPAKSSEIAACFEIGRRLRQAQRRRRPTLKSPEDVIACLHSDLAPLHREGFYCLPLDAKCGLIGEPETVSLGDVDGTEAGPRLFYRCALRRGAVSVIAAHNHPTGDVVPSTADEAVTRRLVQAGRLLDLQLNDHLIIGDGGRYTSLRRSQPHLFCR